MSRNRVGAALVVLAVLATGSAVAADRPARTEGVGGAYKVAATKSPRGFSIVGSAERLADQVLRTLRAAADALRATESITGSSDVRITSPTLKGVGAKE